MASLAWGVVRHRRRSVKCWGSRLLVSCTVSTITGQGTHRTFWLTAVFLFILLDSPTQGQCPERCICKWKGGKETVECVNATLSRIPALDPNTQVLDLSFNNFLKITENVFRDRNLFHLQKVFLHHCSINIVIGRCFEGISNVVELDLSWNLLTAIPKEALTDCSYLMNLNLQGNPIRGVTADSFLALPELQTLDLSQCQLSEIDSGTFHHLTRLRWLKLDSNLLYRLQPGEDFPNGLRGVSLHNNKWRCDCKLRGFQDFLSNNTVAYDGEPLCAEPDRISGQRIRDMATHELACRPQVSPTSTYQEIIQGKNMSLVCSITATPLASITWWYKGLRINNGSTMISDIDRRLYYYRNIDMGQGVVNSELVLLRTNSDDNGTFQCMAENRAGQAVANFSLNVVIPFPPKPPQDVVEDRFQQEYIIAIGVAGVIVSILTTVIVILVAAKCRAVRRRAQTRGDSKIHLYQNSVNGSDMGSSEVSIRTGPSGNGAPHAGSLTGDIWPIDLDTFGAEGDGEGESDSEQLVGPDLLSHTHTTGSWRHRRQVIAIPVETAGGAASWSPGEDGQKCGQVQQCTDSCHEVFLERGMDRLSDVRGRKGLAEAALSVPPAKVSSSPAPGHKLSPPTPFADTRPTNCCFTKYKTVQGVETVANTGVQPSLVRSQGGSTEGGGEARTRLQGEVLLNPALGEQGCSDEDRLGLLRKERVAKSNPEKWCFSTLPRKSLVSDTGSECSGDRRQETGTTPGAPHTHSPEPGARIPKSRTTDSLNLGVLDTHLVLPPPPSFKTVHFAPGVRPEEPVCPSIPTEGLPTRPAREPKSAEYSLMSQGASGDMGQQGDKERQGDTQGTQTETRTGKNCDSTIPKSEVVPIKIRSRDQAINSR